VQKKKKLKLQMRLLPRPLKQQLRQRWLLRAPPPLQPRPFSPPPLLPQGAQLPRGVLPKYGDALPLRRHHRLHDALNESAQQQLLLPWRFPSSRGMQEEFQMKATKV